jgi:hypothetical protein
MDALADCGPPGFASDIGNAVSDVQLVILRRYYKDLTEIYLKNEAYAW